MNQTKYRNWIQKYFVPAVRAVVDFHGPSAVSFTPRELAKEIRLAASDPAYLDVETTLLIDHAQRQYRAAINNNRPAQTRWFFYEFGDRASRALNTAVKLGLLTSTVRCRTTVKRCAVTHIRTILEYKLA